MGRIYHSFTADIVVCAIINEALRIICCFYPRTDRGSSCEISRKLLNRFHAWMWLFDMCEEGKK